VNLGIAVPRFGSCKEKSDVAPRRSLRSSRHAAKTGPRQHALTLAEADPGLVATRFLTYDVKLDAACAVIAVGAACIG
jgi:hypothetical protein